MLVLSRKTNERIFITTPHGDQIVLTLVEIRGAKVRIGFQAGRDVRIFREELLTPQQEDV